MNMTSGSLAKCATSRAAAERYRTDIDGLRAIAVTAVVLFHAGVPGLSGGFAGVDIFFVISGFLIGGIVHREIEEGRFSFVAFYTRRARRILPALITVSMVTLGLGLLLLGPSELKRYAISAIAALAGLSNLWFFHTTDYFTPGAQLEPFLMTWSLGIEEQFYILLPPLLLALRRFPANTVLRAVIILSAVSFLLGLIMTASRPIEAFYFLPTRAWELGIGVGLAIARQTRRKLPRGIDDWLAVVGLSALGAALFLFDEQVRFPGHAALLPTLGTAVLLATPDAWVNRRILSANPLVAVGLVSYSWYLWHWPLLALLHISTAGPVPQPLLLLIAVGSIVPAYACWRWIERPYRRKLPGTHDATTLKRYSIAMAASIVTLAGVVAFDGFPERAGPSARRVETTLAASHNPCLTGYGVDRPSASAECAPPGRLPLVALLGDSHASALGEALRKKVGAHGYGLRQMTAASCPPLQGATLRMLEHPGASKACADFNAIAIEQAATDPRVKLVILTAFWQSPFSKRARAIGDGVVDIDPRFGERSSEVELRIALIRTLRRLRQAGKRVLILGDIPWVKFDPARHVWAKTLFFRGAVEQSIAPSLFEAGDNIDARFFAPLLDEGERVIAESAGAVEGVRLVRLRDLLCDVHWCRASEGALPFFIDQQHLSITGATYVLDRLSLDL